MKIGQASISENGTIYGNPGDQTGREVAVGPYYQFGQNVILRFRDPALGVKAADIMKRCCNNSAFGYSQGGRTGAYTQLKKAGWNPDKVTTKCNCDCSSLVAAVVNAVGIPINPDSYTGNLRAVLSATGKFEAHTGTGWTNTAANLRPGDIILAPGKHVAMALEYGSNVKPKPTPSGKVYAEGIMKVTEPIYDGTVGVINKVGSVVAGQTVKCYGTNTTRPAKGGTYYDGRPAWVWWAINPDRTQWIVYTGRIAKK